MKASKVGGKIAGRKEGGPMINKGREEEEEAKMEGGHNKGGRVKRKAGGPVQQFSEGGMAVKRFDRPGRKRGGGVGAEKRPLTSASSPSDASGHSGGADEVCPK